MDMLLYFFCIGYAHVRFLLVVDILTVDEIFEDVGENELAACGSSPLQGRRAVT
jgi:hypothetical protein